MSDFYEFPEQQDPWNQGTYKTGPTRPKKSHGGLIAILLIVLILFAGVVSALGLLNIQLFKQLNMESPEPILTHTNETMESNWRGTESTIPQTVSDDPVVDISQSPTSPGNYPSPEGLSLQEIYVKCINSVVSISCSYAGGGASSGTGVVLTADGLLVTNCHVVSGAREIFVLFTDGRYLQAELVGEDEISDLAVLRVDAQDLTPAELGDSSALRVGDVVVAIGDPLGTQLRGTMTDGIVSAINRDISVEGRSMSVIQTNAALNSGNSGGPLINCFGQVIGINTMKIGDYVNSAGVEGLGFAIPSTTVREITNQLIQQGYVSGRPTLGITGETVSTLYQFYYRLPEGLYIDQVEENSPADEAGIQEGDILLQADDTRIRGPEDLKAVLYSYTPGQQITLIIYRGGRQYSVDVTVGEANG